MSQEIDPDSYENLTVERDDGIGKIVMERTDHHNAMDEFMAGELRDATIQLDTDDDVRCIVLTGRGAAFNTGADLAEFEGDESDGRKLEALASRLHTAVQHLAGTPKPAITGVNGVAAGGGFGLALAGDLVLVHEDARFDFSYPKIGLSGDGGSTYFLPDLVGQRRAREIVMLPEPIDPDDAVEMGLATEVVADEEFDDRLTELASTLAAGPTRALGATKRLLNESNARTLEDHLQEEKRTIARLAGTDDYNRGYAAFFADEDPEFLGQ